MFYLKGQPFGAIRQNWLLTDIPAEHILDEPAARNTAPCIAWACWSIKKEDPTANVVVTPADAVVMNPEEFRRVISNALAFTEKNNTMVRLVRMLTK